VGLTLETLKRLEDKSFPKLYDDHVDLWTTLLKQTVEFLNNSYPQGDRIRADDIAKSLTDVVAVDDHFRKHTEKIREKHWARDFCDFIVDKSYNDELVKRK